MGNISLRICGNKLANEGFRVLVSIGTPSPDVKDMSIMPGLVENDFYFFLRHEDNQIVYTIQKTRIRSYGAAREGRLIMSIAVPRGFEIIEGGPYEVLMEVYNFFIAKFTISSLGGTQFSNLPDDPTAFQELLSKYTLAPAIRKYVPMLPDRSVKAYIILPYPKQISELFMDSQYNEFQKFGEILIAQEGSTSYPRLTITVPRPVHYKFYVNNIQSSKELTSLTENYTASIDMGECYECVPVSFSLDDLLAGKKIDGIKLDVANEAVFCTLARRPKSQRWRMSILGDNPGFDKLSLRLRTSGVLIKVEPEGCFVLSGDQINETLEIMCTDSTFVKTSVEAKDKINKILSCKFSKRVAAPLVRPGVMRPAGAEMSSSCISIQLTPNNLKDNVFDFTVSDDRRELTFHNVRSHHGIAEFDIPGQFFQSRFLSVSAKSDNYVGEETRIDTSINESYSIYMSKKGLFSKPIVKMAIAALAGLVIGLVVGALFAPRSSSKEETTIVKTDPSEILNKMKKELSAANAVDSLSFDRVREIFKYAAVHQNLDPEFYKKAEAYKIVVEMIQNKESFEKVKLDFEGDSKYGHYLETPIKYAIQATYDNNMGKGYDNNQKKAAAEKYISKDFSPKYFRDLQKIAEEVTARKK